MANTPFPMDQPNAKYIGTARSAHALYVTWYDNSIGKLRRKTCTPKVSDDPCIRDANFQHDCRMLQQLCNNNHGLAIGEPPSVSSPVLDGPETFHNASDGTEEPE